MKAFLQHRSRRWGYDGWAIMMPGSEKPLAWSVCTTRAEARALRLERGNLFEQGAEVVKVRVHLEVVADV